MTKTSPKARQTTALRGEGRATLNGNTRVAGREQYYTPATLAAFLVEQSLPFLPSLADVECLDPAAGTGVFPTALLDAGATVVRCYDIHPRIPIDSRVEITEADFLSSPLAYPGAVVLTNPPFGRK